MQAFFYHPRLGAVAAITSNKKDVDKSPSLSNNTNMCANNIRFVTAVILAVNSLRASPFSVFNITSQLRKQANDGELSFTDKSPETIDGVTTYRVDHQEVREVFRELMDKNVITNLTARNMGSYMEYSDTAPDTCSNTCACVSQPVTQAAPTVTPVPTPLPPDASLRQRVQDYLKGRSGQDVTMKEVQSRFKGVNKTCYEWGKLIADMGLPVNTQGTPSYWTSRI